MTVTVWKNKIRVRHASLGELRQKKEKKEKKQRELDKNQNRHVSVFSWRHKSSQIISKAQQQGKINYCLAGVKGENMNFIYFSYPLLNEYRR